jgi:hypothetical protein
MFPRPGRDVLGAEAFDQRATSDPVKPSSGSCGQSLDLTGKRKPELDLPATHQGKRSLIGMILTTSMGAWTTVR